MCLRVEELPVERSRETRWNSDSSRTPRYEKLRPPSMYQKQDPQVCNRNSHSKFLFLVQVDLAVSHNQTFTNSPFLQI